MWKALEADTSTETYGTQRPSHRKGRLRNMSNITLQVIMGAFVMSAIAVG
jgi:hypothetical protein